MGPERKAPENTLPMVIGRSRLVGFNGAGAKGSGKPRTKTTFKDVQKQASMGPERKAPENGKCQCPLYEPTRASMGPERKAPENGPTRRQYGRKNRKLQWGRSERLRKTTSAGPWLAKSKALQWGRSERLRKTRLEISFSPEPVSASMGPERKAPENISRPGRPRLDKRRFNGAGAKGSGKQRIHPVALEKYGYASMGPERKAPENIDREAALDAQGFASMGPERKAPENCRDKYPPDPKRGLQWGRSERLRKTWRFCLQFDLRNCASMGPERKAPENRLPLEADEQGLSTLFCERLPIWFQIGDFVTQSAWVVNRYFQYFKELTHMRASPGKMRSPSRSKRIGGENRLGSFLERWGTWSCNGAGQPQAVFGREWLECVWNTAGMPVLTVGSRRSRTPFEREFTHLGFSAGP